LQKENRYFSYRELNTSTKSGWNGDTSPKSTITGGILSLSKAGPGVAQAVDGQSVFWKISMWCNPRALSAGMEAITEQVRKDTGGKFNIKISYGGQLSRARENRDGLKLNAFERAAICNFYHPGKNPAWMVFSLPFLSIGDRQVDKYVRTKLFEHPAIVADMEK
jgi:TRAP-type mannitol/chloroaromatic compound transport system substrate-binding protein